MAKIFSRTYDGGRNITVKARRRGDTDRKPKADDCRLEEGTLRVGSTYGTISESAEIVAARVIAIDLLARERKRICKSSDVRLKKNCEVRS